ncbi:O-antigen ligase family protein [Brachybacterium sp. AOP24-D1-21]|uniref:O-antigen ligase family protein n=1 Tax=Brachybacterium sp. AOP24-D1-21 TaxID=3457711 RepID=UPI004034A80C
MIFSHFKASRMRPCRGALPAMLCGGAPRSRYLVLALTAWTLYVLCSAVWAGSSLGALLPYLSFSISLLVGFLAGARFPLRDLGPQVPAVLAVCAVSILFVVPFYANAQAALGLQLLAVASLLSLRLPWAGELLPHHRWAVAALGMLALGAVLLAFRAQAASVLLVPLAVLILCAVVMRLGPPRLAVAVAGLTAIGVAALTVISLGSLRTWPSALNEGGSLSGVRHRLWSDALDLWQASPITGAGPGGFLAHSEIAASKPLWERAHSSVLQVGSELGAIGVVLFSAILVAGAALALQGSRRAGLIAVAAWSALGIHSMIDHLYEYPIVTLTAGIVLGYASKTTEPPAVIDE